MTYVAAIRSSLWPSLPVLEGGLKQTRQRTENFAKSGQSHTPLARELSKDSTSDPRKYIFRSLIGHIFWRPPLKVQSCE